MRMLPLVDWPLDCDQRCELVDLFQLPVDIRMARCIGCSIALLTCSGQLAFYDMNTFVQLYQLDLHPRAADGTLRRVVDFQFLDVDVFAEWESEEVKLLLKLESKEREKYEVGVYHPRLEWVASINYPSTPFAISTLRYCWPWSARPKLRYWDFQLQATKRASSM